MSSTSRALTTVGVAGVFVPAAAAGVVVAGGTHGDGAALEVLAAAVGGGPSLVAWKEQRRSSHNPAAPPARQCRAPGRARLRASPSRAAPALAPPCNTDLRRSQSLSDHATAPTTPEASLVVFQRAVTILTSTRRRAQDDINARSQMDWLALGRDHGSRVRWCARIGEPRAWRDGQVPGSRRLASSLHRFGKSSWRADGFAFWPLTWTGRCSIPRALCVPGRRRPLPGPPELAFARCSARDAATVVPGPSPPSLL